VLRVGTEKQKRYKRTPGSDKLTAVMRSRFPTTIAPYQYAQHKGRKVAIWNRIEALVYIAAHEMRHLWQEARRTDGRKAKADAPRFHGAKGRYSEVDTEAFALHELRKWRRQNFAL
jgi:hypothetical protein